jgi:hypothetical protein
VDDLRSKLENVVDRESFLNFVRALAEDRREKAANEKADPYGGQPGGGWENSTIEAYLSAAVAWAEDSIGQPAGLSREPSWQGFATFLYCGKIYE